MLEDKGRRVIDAGGTTEGRARLRREGASRGWWKIVAKGKEGAEG